jgi:hypothetical protein
MRVRVNELVAVALAALASVNAISRADEAEYVPGDDRWIPSLAVTSGVTLANWAGDQTSFQLRGAGPGVPETLRPAQAGDDRAVTPFVGGNLELMTPALLSHVRLFAAAELLPMFGPERQLAQDGEPSRIRGPDIGAVLAVDEDEFHFTNGAQGTNSGPRPQILFFSDVSANGQGMRTRAQVDKWAYGLKAGASFAFEFRGHEVRVKPSLGWLHYKVSLKGYLLHPKCAPFGQQTICTNTYFTPENPGEPGTLNTAGFLREATLSDRDSGVFDAVGPGVDLEMQTGRLGPVGTALFIGIHAYYQPGDRDISVTTSRSFNDQLGNDTYIATWRTRVAPWVYRGALGVRFQWLGGGA